MLIKPTLQALVLADHVYVDKYSGKFVIAGTYNQLNVFPKPVADATQPLEVGPEGRQLQMHEIFRLGNTFAYVSLTNVRGENSLELRYVNLSDDSVLFKMEFKVAGDDPLKTLEMAMQVPPLPGAVGDYAMELLAQDEILGSHRVRVVEIQPPQ
jgi:hypothetical protein